MVKLIFIFSFLIVVIGCGNNVSPLSSVASSGGSPVVIEGKFADCERGENETFKIALQGVGSTGMLQVKNIDSTMWYSSDNAPQGLRITAVWYYNESYTVINSISNTILLNYEYRVTLW